MKEPNNKDNAHKPDLEAEIRRERKFSLTEAVAREAGGSLKGASPVARTQQLLQQIKEILDRKLPDSEGSLIRTIIARLEGNPPLLARHFDRPEAALSELLSGLLDSPANLEILVRQADARWGRDYDERPHFERDGSPPHPDDPYTRAGVRALLQALHTSLNQTQSDQI
jgi:hypothetical protein